MNPWASLMLLQVPSKRKLPNPHPPGVILSGSASDAVKRYLEANPGKFFNRRQIIHATGRTMKSVDAALLFLRSLGLIDVIPDAARCSRYLRYRIREGAK